jgi:hypothetical protein
LPAAGPSSPLPGTRVAIGQGVAVIMPPGFRTHVDANGITFGVDARGVAIAGVPILVPTDDPTELAQAHARSNGLVFETMQQIFVGGAQRPMAFFHGNYAGVAVRQIAVPLIGPGYRMAVMFQAPTKLMSDPKVEAMALELYTRRIALP